MYTEFYFSAELKKLPSDVEEVILYLSGQGEEPDKLPDNIFFKSHRWDLIGRCSSSYTFPESFIQYKDNNLLFLCSLKNYDDEIEKFGIYIPS